MFWNSADVCVFKESFYKVKQYHETALGLISSINSSDSVVEQLKGEAV